MRYLIGAVVALLVLCSPAMAVDRLYDAFGNVWAFDTSGVVYENGIVVAVSDTITSMEYKNGSIYAHGSSWWRFTNNAFASSSAP